MSELYDYVLPKERIYQDEIIRLFQEMKYKYLGDLQYGRNQKARPDGMRNMPIIEEEVKAYLRERGYTEMQVAEAYDKLKAAAYLPKKGMVNLMARNCEFYQTLVRGVKCKPSAERNDEDVLFLYWGEDFEKNRFAIAEEVSYIDDLTGVGSRPDLVVYVNGIALAVIELKRASVSEDKAVKQMLSNECDNIPSFFTTVQYTVAASSENGFLYGTINSPKKFWCPFKKPNQDIKERLSDLESFRLFFDPETFIRLVRFGVVNDGGTKKVMRPHQYYALVNAIPRLKAKQSGVIWHSQGSGKSLTMVWLASYIKENFDNARVIVITDRTELDEQICCGFVDAGENVGHAKSGYDLLNRLNEDKDWLVCTLIHKFGKHSETDENEMKIRLDVYLEELRGVIAEGFPNGFSVKGNNVFVFVDECHRTQGGRLHEAMREILGKDVMLIGFTGTPLLKEDKAKEYEDIVKVTEVKFGKFIHKYLNKEAVADKVILDLAYESRDVEEVIVNKNKLDEKKAELMQGLSEERCEQVEQRWATLEKVFSAKERIQRIGCSILDDMASGLLGQSWCNAMLVAGDIYSAYRYYDFFQNLSDNHSLRNRCAVVTSYNPSDADMRNETDDPSLKTENQYKHDMALQSYADASALSKEPITNSEKYEAWVKPIFKKYPGRMKLLIVVDKLLTGFDAPSATILYIDKEMRDHNLFQALCRVNRLGVDLDDEYGNKIISHKEYGLIVDFKIRFEKIGNAIVAFNGENGAFGRYDPADIEGLLNEAIKERKERLEDAMQAYLNLKREWADMGLNDREALKTYYLTDQQDVTAEELRRVLYQITGALIVAYCDLANYMGKAGYSKEESERIERLAKEARDIREYIKHVSGDFFDAKQYDPAMRELIDRFVRANEAETIVAPTSEFSFLDLLNEEDGSEEAAEEASKKAGSDEAAAEIIEGKVRCVINTYKKRDPEQYKKFSEKLQEILDLIKEQNKSFAEAARLLINLVVEAKGGGTHYPEAIKTAFAKAFWNNRKNIGIDDDGRAEALALAIEEFIKYEATRGWEDPVSVAGYELQTDLKREFRDLDDEQLLMIYKLAVENNVE